MYGEIYNHVSAVFFSHGCPNNKVAIDKVTRRILKEEQEHPGLVATIANHWDYAVMQIMMDIVNEEGQ